MAMPDQPLERRVHELPCWQGQVTATILKGGVSNTSFKVADGRGAYVARFGSDYPFHQVFRDTELAASRAAHAAGLSPEVVHAEPGVMVVRLVPGRTFGEADVRDNLERCVELVRRCHREMPRRIRGRIGFFWVFQVVRGYLAELQERGHGQAGRAAEWSRVLDRLEAAQAPLPIVFGHHDLLPSNFIDDGERLWLIDWEYGGFGTAMFDLANLSSNNQFTETIDQRLLDCYFGGRPAESVIRAFEAMKCASALREATWGMVSEIHLGATGIDYIGYAAEYLGRYEALLSAFEAKFGRT